MYKRPLVANGTVFRDGTGESESQIVRTPLRGFYDCMGKPDRIVFSLKSPIDFTVFGI